MMELVLYHVLFMIVNFNNKEKMQTERAKNILYFIKQISPNSFKMLENIRVLNESFIATCNVEVNVPKTVKQERELMSYSVNAMRIVLHTPKKAITPAIASQQ